MKRSLFLLTPVGLILFGLACSEAPKKEAEKKEKKAPELVSGQKAFFRMYGQARGSWAQDLEAFKLEPIPLSAMPAKDGLYPAWKAMLVSPSKRAMKTYSFSVIEAEGIHEGIFSTQEEAYNGARGQNITFPIAGFKIDSPAALETALKKGADYSKKFPETPVHLLLEKTKELNDPAWRVYWGPNIAGSNYSIYIDAATGEYIKTMH